MKRPVNYIEKMATNKIVEDREIIFNILVTPGKIFCLRSKLLDRSKKELSVLNDGPSTILVCKFLNICEPEMDTYIIGHLHNVKIELSSIKLGYTLTY